MSRLFVSRSTQIVGKSAEFMLCCITHPTTSSYPTRCCTFHSSIRRIYFSDRLYTEEELPAEFKLFLPLSSSGPPPSAAGAAVVNKDETSNAEEKQKNILVGDPKKTEKPVAPPEGKKREEKSDAEEKENSAQNLLAESPPKQKE